MLRLVLLLAVAGCAHDTNTLVDNFERSTGNFSDERKLQAVFAIMDRVSRNVALKALAPRTGRLSDFNETLNETSGNATEAQAQHLPKVVLEYIAKRYYSRVPSRKYSTAFNEFRFASSCDYFTSSVCLKSKDYPLALILKTIERNSRFVESVLINENDYMDGGGGGGGNGGGVSGDHGDSNVFLGGNSLERSDDSNGFMCKSIIKIARPQKAKNANGVWKYIVNTAEHTQTLRLEKCLEANGSCTYLSDSYETRCLQVHNYHRLLSWDEHKGLHLDIFKVPTCCACHVDNYKVQFPPIGHLPVSKTHLDQIRGSDFEYTVPAAGVGSRVASSSHDYYASTSDADLPPLYTRFDDDSKRRKAVKRQPVAAIDYGLGGHRIQQHVADDVSDLDDYEIANEFLSSQRYNSRAKKKPNSYFTTLNEFKNRFANRNRLTSEISDLIVEESQNQHRKISSRNDSIVDAIQSAKRINFDYHPILEFFDRDNQTVLSSNTRLNLQQHYHYQKLPKRSYDSSLYGHRPSTSSASASVSATNKRSKN